METQFFLFPFVDQSHSFHRVHARVLFRSVHNFAFITLKICCQLCFHGPTGGIVIYVNSVYKLLVITELHLGITCLPALTHPLTRSSFIPPLLSFSFLPPHFPSHSFHTPVLRICPLLRLPPLSLPSPSSVTQPFHQFFLSLTLLLLSPSPIPPHSPLPPPFFPSPIPSSFSPASLLLPLPHPFLILPSLTPSSPSQR